MTGWEEPDRTEGWLKAGETEAGWVASFNAERARQWDDFYSLATCQKVSDGHMDQFTRTSHPVGQHEATVVEVLFNGLLANQRCMRS